MDGAERFRRLFVGLGASDNLKSRSVRGGAFSMAAEGIDFFLRLVSVAVLARLLVPEHFGLLSMVTAITSVAERFKDLGLAIATVQKKEITHQEVSNLFWINASVGATVMLIVAICARPVALFYDDARLLPITLAIASSFFWSGLAIQHHALLRRQMKFGQVAIIQVASSCLSIVLAVVLAKRGAGYWALVAREVSRNLFMTAGAWVCLPWIPGAPSRRSKVHSLLRLGADVTAFNLVYFLSASFDQILIGKILGPTSLGIYRQGFQLVLGPVNQLTFPVNVVAESALSRLQSDPEAYRRFYRGILGALSLTTMPLAVFVGVFAEELVLVMLGSQWLASTQLVRLFAIAAFLRPAESTAGFVMVTSGKSRRYFWLGLLTSVTLVLSLVIGIRWGAVGVASAHVVSIYLLLIPKLRWSFKETPISLRVFGESVSRPLISSVVMGCLLSGLKWTVVPHGALETVGLGVSVSMPVYLGVWFLMPGGALELRHLAGHLGSSFSRRKPAS